MKLMYRWGLLLPKFALIVLLSSTYVSADQPAVPWLNEDPGLASKSSLFAKVADYGQQAGLESRDLIDLYRAVAMAVEVHPAVQASINAVLEQKNMIDSAQAGYYPRLSADISSGRLSEHGNAQLATITLSQLIYDFGKTRSKVGHAQNQRAKSVASLIKQIDDVSYRVAVAYINVHRYQTLLAVAEKQVTALSDVYDRSLLRAGSGLATQSDPIQAKSRLESAEASKVEMETLLAQWTEQLGLLIGQDSGLTIGQLPSDLESSVNFAAPVDYQTIPELLEANAEREVAVSLLEHSKAQRYPTLTLEASSNHALSGVNPNNGDDHGSFNSIQLKGTALLYQGGAVSAQIRAAYAKVSAADELIRDVRLRVDERLKKTLQELRGEKRRLHILEQRYSSILETASLYQEEYTLGKRSILDLLNAEQEAYFAATDREDSKYAYLFGVVEYIATSGKSREVYGISDKALWDMEGQQ
ncbi:TolC family outer membrane protein [Pseudomonas sp. TTU2014-080ASC]|uniref:TolC family outer membrane protein n=1 Tax=Pseudomonas sp. TTU2014-080ASC TaxID=1729724 RepID=UPI0007184B3C|nr:TolC family outer membrane protein [Pseudomonas sp. TTU2014-080ASC]KRW57860.1 hypothetical protein AO726_19590 [Pseudomonas sp. TTU2014-080ASC]